MSASRKTLKEIENCLVEAANNIVESPLISLHCSRKVLEVIAKDICCKERGLQASTIKNHQLNKLLIDINSIETIPIAVKRSMGTVQIYGNYGSHGQDVSMSDSHVTSDFIDVCINALKHIFQWYIKEYLKDVKRYDLISSNVNKAFRVAKHISIYKEQREKIAKFTSENLIELTHKVKADLEGLDLFKDKFSLYSIQKTLPKPICEGTYEFVGQELELYNEEINLFDEDNKKNKELTNEPHAIMTQKCLKESVFDYISEDDDIEELTYLTTNYIGVRTLRHPNIAAKPQIISAGAITISPVERKLYFQQRGNKVATYKHHFHIMGGNFVGEVVDSTLEVSTDKTDSDLTHTIFREILEESNINTDKYDCKTGLYSIGREDDTGFIQVEAHAVCLLSERDLEHGDLEYADITANWEGGIYGINFDSLEDFLKYTYDRWVPSGLAHVLIWLALDAPYAPELDGKNIYESVIKHIKGQANQVPIELL